MYDSTAAERQSRDERDVAQEREANRALSSLFLRHFPRSIVSSNVLSRIVMEGTSNESASDQLPLLSPPSLYPPPALLSAPAQAPQPPSRAASHSSQIGAPQITEQQLKRAYSWSRKSYGAVEPEAQQEESEGSESEEGMEWEDGDGMQGEWERMLGSKEDERAAEKLKEVKGESLYSLSRPHLESPASSVVRLGGAEPFLLLHSPSRYY
jgi:hypothetical protein